MFSLDIETMPDMSMVDLLPEVKADSRLKDEEKIKADIQAKKDKQISEMALNPMFAKIICICIYSPTDSVKLYGDDEKDILVKFWEYMANHKDEYFITYNGKAYDLDVINKRSIKYDLGSFKINRLLCDKYKGERHIDIMQDFCGFGKFEKLDTLAKVYLGDSKIDIDFEEFPELIKTQEGWDKITNYCMQDAKITYDLAKKLGY